MIPIAIALALGFIVGDSIRQLKLAILASVAAGALTAIAFMAVPLVLSGAFHQVQFLLKPMLTESFFSALVALIGLYFGRRRARKGFGG